MSDDEDKRNISRKGKSDDNDKNLRPQFLREIIRQEKVVEQLQIQVEAAKARREPLNHILFYGPPGLGKTTLSHVMAKERGVNVRVTAGPPHSPPHHLSATLPTLPSQPSPRL